MADSLPDEMTRGFEALRDGGRKLRGSTTEAKNAILNRIADRVIERQKSILSANEADLARLPAETSPAFRDRLALDSKRLEAITESLRHVAHLPDPVGEITEEKTLPNGLRLRRERAPLGVIFMIFESRPNVIFEAFSLAFKSGNSIALRGGSESRSTAEVAYRLITEVLAQGGFDFDMPFFGITDYDRKWVEIALKKKEWIDVVVPRGGDKLIDFVQRTSAMPIIKNDRGLCHAYVDSEADLEMALRIVDNGKTQRPSVCNSLETVLVHERVAPLFLPKLHAHLSGKGVTLKCDPLSLPFLAGKSAVEAADATSFDTEYLDLVLNCRVVSGLTEAIRHIERHGSRHSETIITTNESTARRFQSEVDAAAVYWNASTRFTDGFEFGLGGELGISTQKLHVRGPVGLRELTTPRWVVDGTGQTR